MDWRQAALVLATSIGDRHRRSIRSSRLLPTPGNVLNLNLRNSICRRACNLLALIATHSSGSGVISALEIQDQ
jgi:hypothetical protein